MNANPQHGQDHSVPAPSHSERDEVGRLVALTIDGVTPLPAQRGDAWLVAVDGSAHAVRAVTEAIHVTASGDGGMLHLLNVQPWLSKEAAEAELAARSWHATSAARALLDASGRPWQLHVTMGDSAEQIVAVAGRLGCHGIVIGSRGLGATENLLVGSVAYKVIHLSPLAVLVVR